MMNNKKQSYGFSLVELMVAMVVGLIIVSGAFSLHTGSRKTQKVNEMQMDMVADARFAIEMIAYDLRHAGMWGGTNKVGLIDCKSSARCNQSTSSGDAPPADITDDCVAGWYYNLSRPIFATDDTAGNPYSTSCIKDSEAYLAGTDILEVRYADSNVTIPVNLQPSQVYVRSNFKGGRVFVGATQPVLDSDDSNPLTQNHELYAYAYYISNFTDDPTDGIPSLRRVALVNSVALNNQTLISGVTDLQLQFGIDVDDDQQVDRYVDPNAVTDWLDVYAAKIWLVMRSDKEQTGNVNKVKTFPIPGPNPTPGAADKFRYFMVSSVINLRNRKEL